MLRPLLLQAAPPAMHVPASSLSSAASPAAPAPVPGVRGAAADPLVLLRDPLTIRARAGAIAAAIAEGRSGWFRLDRSRLPEATARVLEALRGLAPASTAAGRWRHFGAGGVDRRARLAAALAELAPAARLHAELDLTVLGALLDVDPGAAWSWRESHAQQTVLPTAALPAAQVGRDELLAALDAAAGPAAAGGSAAGSAAGPAAAPRGVGPDADPAATLRLGGTDGLVAASLNAFLAGAFSDTPGEPCRVDAAALQQVDAAALRAIFQVGSTNPLCGLEARAGMLQRLGQVLQQLSRREGVPARPALLLHRLTGASAQAALGAEQVLQELLHLLDPVLCGPTRAMGVTLGDVWPHRFAGGDDPITRGLLPLHARGLWLCASLQEPLQRAGVELVGMEALCMPTGLEAAALLLDCGVLVPRHARAPERAWKPGDECVVEARALAVTLQDELVAAVQAQRGPLAWHAVQQGILAAAGAGAAAPWLRVEGDGILL